MAEQSNSSPEPVETLDILNEETEETEESEQSDAGESTEPESESEEKEEKEEEIKLADEDEDKETKEEEIVTPDKRKEILKKYPNIFKEFPYLQKAYYREQQFTEVFPTVEDAKEAVTKASTFDQFEQQLLSGNTANILKVVKETDPEAFNKITDNYLVNLLNADQGAYYHVIGNVIKQTVLTMMQDGRAKNNEITQEAAKILHQFVFGTDEFQPPARLSKPETPQDQELQNERMGFIKERFEIARDDLGTKVSNVLQSTISQHIDPKESMSDYVKKNASKDAYENLEALLGSDRAFRNQLDKLWEKAFESRFSKQSLDTIRSAYLSKAKTLLPRVIQKSRNEALRGLGRRASSDSKETPSLIKRGTTPPSSSGKKLEIPANMSTKEWLMQD